MIKFDRSLRLLIIYMKKSVLKSFFFEKLEINCKIKLKKTPERDYLWEIAFSRCFFPVSWLIFYRFPFIINDAFNFIL